MLSKSQIIFLYSFAYLLLLYGYKAFVVPVYGYSGFAWVPDTFKILEGMLLTVVISAFLPAHFRKPSDILLHLQFLFPVLPMLALYGVQDYPRVYLYMSVISFMLMFVLAQRISFKAVRLNITLSSVLFHQLLLLSGWSVVVVILMLGGYRYFNINLLKVYEFRSVAANNLPSIFGYISPLVSNVIFPFSLLISVVKKEYLFVFISIGGSVMMFALTAHKGPLFYPFIVLSLYYILQRRHVIQELLAGYSIIIILSVLLYFSLDTIVFGSFLLRRTMLVPANLNYLYFDFFSENPFVWWARSKITFNLIDYSYPLDISHLIGAYYFDRPECGANTGWIGSGYANAGFPGMLLCAILIGLFLAVLNAYGKALENTIVVAIVTTPLLAVFMSSDPFTAFLTHGVIFSLLLLIFLPLSIVTTKRYRH